MGDGSLSLSLIEIAVMGWLAVAPILRVHIYVLYIYIYMLFTCLQSPLTQLLFHSVSTACDHLCVLICTAISILLSLRTFIEHMGCGLFTFCFFLNLILNFLLQWNW